MIESVTRLLQDLVRVPSVNPENDPGTDQVGEARMAEVVAGLLEAMGATVTVEEVLPGRPNVLGRFAPLDGRPRVLLAPHLDTVGVGGMVIDPFSGEERDGRIWGRGASDTKGPMAAMLWGLWKNRDRLASSPVAVDFAGFMAEESGQWGSKDFARRHGKDYSFALAGEPTSMKIVHVTKGSLWATLRARGKAAHSSQPERGENAIVKLVRSVSQLVELLQPVLAGFSHPMLGPSTLNVGVIRGGSRPNIVPDFAEVELDIRVTPELVRAGGGMHALEHAIHSLHLPVEVVDAHENPPMETSLAHPIAKSLLAMELEPAGAPWFSDAAHLSDAGVPSVCVGPGSIDQAHTVDEFISIADLIGGAEIFERWIADLATLALSPAEYKWRNDDSNVR